MKLKKILKAVFCFFVVLSIYGMTASAQETDDIYKEQYDLSGADSLTDSLPYDTQNHLEELGINASDYNWVNAVNAESVFAHIFEIIKTGAKKPLTVGAALIAIILISAAFNSVSDGSSSSLSASFATVLSSAAVLINPLLAVISNTVGVLKAITVFMSAFIPIFAGIVAAGGGALSAVSMSAVLLGATNVISYIASFVVVPLLCGYLSLSIAASVSPLVAKTGIADGIKQLSLWIMSLLSTVFIGILSIQTSVNAAADTLGLKTAKFVLGSAVPVAGTALSEALSTVTASMGLLRSSVGIYAVYCCVAIILPFLSELLLWKLMLTVVSAVADLFAASALSSLLKSVNTVVTVTIGIILLTAVLFIISLAVVTGARSQ